MTDQKITRRHVIGGAAVAGVGVPLLAACGSGDAINAEGASGSGAGSGSGGPVTLGPTSDVPVGGGKLYPDANVVVTQPTAGDFQAFSATCTHKGCQVSSISDGTINCACHGSKFSIKDGSNVAGPDGQPAGSVEPLEKATVKVAGGKIVEQS